MISNDTTSRKKELLRHGYTVLRRAMDQDVLRSLRTPLRDHFYAKGRRTGGVVSDYEPDALGRLPFTRTILDQPGLFRLVSEVLGFQVHYCHHSDVHINKTAPWHRDSIKKASYFDFCQQEIFGTRDYRVFKIGVYLQSHQDTTGLSVIPGSHKKDGPPETGGATDIGTVLGDVILFDTRLFHMGIDSLSERRDDSDRISFFMTLADDNRITREFVNGTIWRQNRQLKRCEYVLPEELRLKLEGIDMPFVPYDPRANPSPESVLEELERVRRVNRALEKELDELYAVRRAVRVYKAVKRKVVGATKKVSSGSRSSS